MQPNQPNPVPSQIPSETTSRSSVEPVLAASPSFPAQEVTTADQMNELSPDDQPVDLEDASATLPFQALSWDASESIEHDKDTMWFIILGLVAFGFIALSIWLKAWTFTALVVVMLVAVVYMARRAPATMHYQLTSGGLYINDKRYELRDFRAFGVVQDGAFYYITLIPIKRFMPAIDVYFPEEHGEQIVDVFGAVIPMQTIQPDGIDRLMRRLRL